MDKITRVGVDLAKNVMQIHAVDGAEHIVVRKAITREQFVNWFANLKPCLVAMESCSAAHYWARKLRALGHEVRLIPPQFAAPYRKGGARVKNDALDAEAICEAASRPHMRFVPVKSPAQQSVLVLHRMRTGFVEERTALANRLRGLLVEFGVFLPQGMHQLHKHFIDRVEDGNNELTGPARQALMRGWAQLQTLDEEIAWFDRQIAEHANHDPQAQRCMDVCGVGRLTASAAVATVVDARQFKNGRQMAAWLGLVPKQNSSGGKQRLGRITKQGDGYLRTLLFQGARSAVLTAHQRNDRLARWIVQLQARVGYYKTLVAVANKHARILWAVLAKGERFDPSHAPARTRMAAGA
ncbi:transposase [Burkholderia ubonensis]|uniref:IS110 family transposase n=1 Tax=Burkholderia ubonensis TaxID=101571 RepID=UPI000759D9B4|nr:IS110 family transposase [Burkholderia ubonensis]KWO82402.1 transposase [Burkholderia ubonensis]